ncbi:MAG: transketolase C-terminal domain-containing protein [Syntrophales bacterium]
MRQAFYDHIEKIAVKDTNVYILTANLGFKFLDNIRESCSGRFLDVGVAEANMIGIAAGLALSGKNVYCYSIIPFLTMRAYEQIRVDIAYHNLNVKLVGMGAGFTYGFEGFTHFGIEDMALMRAMPNMHVVVPDTIENAVQVAQLSYEYPLPLYIRLGRAGINNHEDRSYSFEIGKGIILREGKEIVIFAIGNMVEPAWQTIKSLGRRGISATLINMHTIKPLDVELIQQCASAHNAVFTVEEHSIIGGLGSAVGEVLAENSYGGIFKRIGIPETLDRKIVGTADYLWQSYGLTVDAIGEKILSILEKELL